MRTHPSTVAGFLLILSGCGISPQTAQTDRDLRVADIELASGDPTAALRIAQEIVAGRPDDVAALVHLGQADQALGLNDDAESSFRRALRFNGSSREATLGLARIHLKSNPAQALTELTALARETPDDPKILTDMGVAYDMLGQHAQAQSRYEHALDLSPGVTATQIDLGLSLALSGHPERALALLGPLAQTPDAPSKIRQDYALAVTLAGRADDARAILNQDLPKDQVVLALDAYQDLRGGQ